MQTQTGLKKSKMCCYFSPWALVFKFELHMAQPCWFVVLPMKSRKRLADGDIFDHFATHSGLVYNTTVSVTDFG